MAFSYSDKNFTVIGNLCFVHIILDGTKRFYDIPPAIRDRMLFEQVGYIYPYFPVDETMIGYGTGGFVIPDIGFARIANGSIVLSGLGNGYLSFYFPIDSNK